MNQQTHNTMIATEVQTLEAVVEETGVTPTTAKDLQDNFLPFFNQAKEWKAKALSLVVTDVSQVEEMKQAREARLALRSIRVEADKTRKALKEDSIRYGRAVQGVYNVIDYLIRPIEAHLDDQEKFVERKEAERKAILKRDREHELDHYIEFVPDVVDLGELSDSDYDLVKRSARMMYDDFVQTQIDQQKAEAERKRIERLEYDRRQHIAELAMFIEDFRTIKFAALSEDDYKDLVLDATAAKSKHEQEQERVKAENERLRKIDEERKKSLEAAEAKVRAQEAEQKKAEAEAAANIESERAAQEAIEAAPDKQKLKALAETFRNWNRPTLKTKKANMTADEVEKLLAKVALFIEGRL